MAEDGYRSRENISRRAAIERNSKTLKIINLCRNDSIKFLTT